MNTRKILVISSDRDFVGIIKISALTLTKLNCQVSIDEVSDFDKAVQNSSEVNLDLIIIDKDLPETDSLKLLNEIRKHAGSKNKKIIYIYSDTVNREEVFKAGCDSIMSKDEFKKVVNNLLVL